MASSDDDLGGGWHGPPARRRSSRGPGQAWHDMLVRHPRQTRVTQQGADGQGTRQAGGPGSASRRRHLACWITPSGRRKIDDDHSVVSWSRVPPRGPALQGMRSAPGPPRPPASPSRPSGDVAAQPLGIHSGARLAHRRRGTLTAPASRRASPRPRDRPSARPWSAGSGQAGLAWTAG